MDLSWDSMLFISVNQKEDNMELNVKDEIVYSSQGGETYQGIITWFDDKAKEAGVAIIRPESLRGSYEVIKYEERDVRVVEQFRPTTFREDLSEMSVEELRLEVEKIRTARAISTKAMTKTKVATSPKRKLLMQQLENLPEDVVNKLLEGK